MGIKWHVIDDVNTLKNSWRQPWSTAVWSAS